MLHTYFMLGQLAPAVCGGLWCRHVYREHNAHADSMATRAMSDSTTGFVEHFADLHCGDCVQASFDGGKRGDIGAGGWVIHRMSRLAPTKALAMQGGQKFLSITSMEAELRGLELLLDALSGQFALGII